MVNTFEDQVIEATKSFLKFESSSGLHHIDTQGQKVQKAIKELADTYHYACLSVSTAFQTAQRIQEIRSEELRGNRDTYFKTCYQVYTHKVEQILDALSETFITIVNLKAGEYYLQLFLSHVRLIVKKIKQIGVEFYDFLFTAGN